MMMRQLGLVAAVLIALVTVHGTMPLAAAHEATPEATPIPILQDLTGATDAASRSFRASNLSERLIFTVVEFDSIDHASDAGPIIVDRYRSSLEQEFGSVNVDTRRASSRAIGDEILAYEGEVLLPEEDVVDRFAMAYALVRIGRYIFFGIGGSFTGDPLAGLLDVIETVLGRSPGDSATPVGRDGLRTGGLWDMLPRLDDLPEGFALEEERIPEPFPPLPDQDTPSA